MAYSRRNGPNRRDRWTVAVARTPSVPAAARLFLATVLAKHMNANGIVSIPRTRLAAQANVSERRVTRFITQAKEAGFLTVVQPGYRTMTAVYQATFPDANSGNRVFPLSEQESGNTTVPLSAGTQCSPITAGKREQSVPTTSTYVLETPESVIYPQTAAGSDPFGIGNSKAKKDMTSRTLRLVAGDEWMAADAANIGGGC